MYGQMKIDPCGQFAETPVIRIAEALGVLPAWVGEWDRTEQYITLKEYLGKRYKYGLHEMTGGSIDDNGVFSFPDDPDMYPLCKISTKAGTLYQYKSAIVAIPTEAGLFVTRMD